MFTPRFYKAIEEWREKTYPGSDLTDIGLKLGEEAGEVQGAIFKNKWGDHHIQHIYEEVGDAGLVLASVCQWMEWDLETVIKDRAIQKGMIDA